MDQAILVEGERIRAIGAAGTILAAAPPDAAVIDLAGATVLPGLIDCHTHLFLQGYLPEPAYDDQLLKESIPYRTIRATVSARTALANGFTALIHKPADAFRFVGWGRPISSSLERAPS